MCMQTMRSRIVSGQACSSRQAVSII